MIKRLTTYIAVAASLVLGACSEETLRPDVPDAGGEEGVRVSIAIPDMPRLATRAFGDTPAADLKLTVFELWAFREGFRPYEYIPHEDISGGDADADECG